jgi:hypothetical protein
MLKSKEFDLGNFSRNTVSELLADEMMIYETTVLFIFVDLLIFIVGKLTQEN